MTMDSNGERGPGPGGNPYHERVAGQERERSRPRPERLPEPTYRPALLALGIALLGFGVTTSFILSGIGLVLSVIALAGWIGEIHHEFQD
jgi:hypothetical protein